MVQYDCIFIQNLTKMYVFKMLYLFVFTFFFLTSGKLLNIIKGNNNIFIYFEVWFKLYFVCYHMSFDNFFIGDYWDNLCDQTLN